VRCAYPFFPFTEAPYVVLHVDHEYSMAVVGTPDRQSLWLLTRGSTASLEETQQFHSIALCNGYKQRQLDTLIMRFPVSFTEYTGAIDSHQSL